MRKNQEIQKELEDISPLLAKDDANDVYVVDENYFDELPISILKNCNSTNTSNVPEHYFETLPNSILLKINKNKTEHKVKSKIFYIRLAVAAVVIGLLGMIILLILNKETDNTSPFVVKKPSIKETLVNASNINVDAEVEKLNEEEIVSYLEENGHDVNAALVASLEEDNYDESVLETDKPAIH